MADFKPFEVVEGGALGERCTGLSSDQASLDNIGAKAAKALKALKKLSSREVQVLSRLVLGESSAMIAKYLEISPSKVEIDRANMMKKLGAGSTADAVRIGIYASLAREDT